MNLKCSCHCPTLFYHKWVSDWELGYLVFLQFFILFGKLNHFRKTDISLYLFSLRSWCRFPRVFRHESLLFGLRNWSVHRKYLHDAPHQWLAAKVEPYLIQKVFRWGNFSQAVIMFLSIRMHSHIRHLGAHGPFFHTPSDHGKILLAILHSLLVHLRILFCSQFQRIQLLFPLICLLSLSPHSNRHSNMKTFLFSSP